MAMFRLVLAIVLCALMAPAAASAQALRNWGTAGGWDVLIDPTLGNGCLIQAEFLDGSLVRIGIDRTTGAGYVLAFNESWSGIEAGKVYPIRFDLDGQIYDGEAKGMYLNGVPGADIYFDSVDFLFDIAKKHVMTLYNESGEVMAIDLEGTFVGLEAVLQCHEENG